MVAEACGEPSPKSSFVKVLLPNFSTKLKLPPAFVKKNITEEEKTSRTATLLGPDGKYWKISLGNEKGKHLIYFFGKEWNKCVQVYGLQDGYFLHFCYEGKMDFNFTVYDLTACEKTYPLLTHVSETNQAAGETSRGIRTCRGHHHFQIVLKSPSGTKTFCCKDCSCIRFEANLIYCNIAGPCMRIPTPFRELSGFSKEKKREATLADQTGRFWPVNLVHHTRKGNIYDSHIGKGWLEFVRANQLKLGDTCAFEMEAGEKEVIKAKKINS